MLSELNKLRQQWEKGLDLLQVFDLRNTHGSVISVLQVTEDDDDPRFTGSDSYHVMRYFMLGDKWYASSDLQDGTTKQVLKELSRATLIGN